MWQHSTTAATPVRAGLGFTAALLSISIKADGDLAKIGPLGPEKDERNEKRTNDKNP